MGEQAYVGTVGANQVDGMRSLSNPRQSTSDQRDHYSDYYAGADNYGGRHINATIVGLAFYLMVKGGDHPNPIYRVNSVPAIGLNAAQQVFYDVMRNNLTPAYDFRALRDKTVERATNLWGSAFGTSVSKAWKEVGIQSCTKPSAPASMTLIDQSCLGWYDIQWSGVASAQWYQVQRSPYSNFSLYYVHTGGNFNSCTYQAFSNTWFRVKACNACGCSAYAYAPGYARYHSVCE